MSATTTTHTRPCLHCGAAFVATRANARFCSPAHRAAFSRSERIAIAMPHTPIPGAIRSIAVPNLAETLDVIMAKSGILPEPAEFTLRWEMVNGATHKLTDGTREKAEGPMGFATTRAIAYAVDRGITDRASWHAVFKHTTIGPAWMEAAGLSMDRAGLAEARLVAEAMVTGDIRPLVLAAHQLNDCTDDMRLALRGMLELLAEPVDDEDDEPTELPDFETEEMMVARLNFHWCVVEGDGCWILQHRIGDDDDWEWAGRFRHKRGLVHAIGFLAGDVDAAAMEVIVALPEKPGEQPSADS